MNHPSPRALAYLLLFGCNILACSLQVPNESDVFGKSSIGGRVAASFTSAGSSGSSSSTAGNSTSGGTTSVGTVGGSSTGGNGGTSANASGGIAGAANSAGGPTAGGSVAASGNGGTSASAGGPSSGSGGALGGAAGSSGLKVTGGGPTASAGSGGTSPLATGGVSGIGGAQPGGAQPGGAPATGGAATGGAPPQVILQYNFEQGSGTTAVDSTANHNDGTLSDVSWLLTGRNGGSANYAAADSQIAIPSSLLGTSRSLTVAAWVSLSANTAENRLFYFGTSNGSSYLTLTFNNSVNGISVRFKSATGTEQVLTTPTQLPLSVWKHITVSVSNVGAAMYVDGKIVAQDNTLVMDPTTLDTPMTNFVGSSPTAGQSFQGHIDEFYVYNGILPLRDIRQLAWPKSDYSIYHLDEGTGTATLDSSDRAINGTLTGGATWVSSPFGTGVMLANSSNPATAAQQYVTLLDGVIANCTTTLTLSAWIYLMTNSTDGPVLEFGSSDTLLTNLATYSTAKALPMLSHYFIDVNKTFTVRLLGSVYDMGQWTHIASVRGDNSNGAGRFAAVYQNGVQKAVLANTGTGAYYATPTPLSFFGRSHTATAAGFNGAIDEVLVACRQYTDDEIRQLAYLPPN